MSKTTKHEQSVKAYYEENTRRFLQLGPGKAGSIHQALWGPEVHSLAEALDYSNDLIYKQLAKLSTLNAIDLGCGTGNTLAYIASRLPATAHLQGITISEIQAKLAEERLQEFPNATIYQGSFLKLPEGIKKLNAAFAIEAFVHAADAATFFSINNRSLGKWGESLSHR